MPHGKGQTRRSKSTTKIKGTKARYDNSPTVSTIHDARTGEIITLYHNTKIYSRMRRNAVKESDPEGQRFKPLGKTRKINGFSAEAYQRTDEMTGDPMTQWIVKDFPHGEALAEALAGSQDESSIWRRTGDRRPPGHIIRTESVAADGTKFVSTSTSVRAQKLPDSTFEIPAGYKEETHEVTREVRRPARR